MAGHHRIDFFNACDSIGCSFQNAQPKSRISYARYSDSYHFVCHISTFDCWDEKGMKRFKLQLIYLIYQ